MKLDHLRKMREQNALFANNMYSKSSQEDEVFTDSSSSASTTQMVTPKHEQGKTLEFYSKTIFEIVLPIFKTDV